MPGIVTHNRILKESILSLSKKEKKSYLLKSIETLFNSPQHMTAGLFGSIGPDIFDFIPRINKRKYYGNDISFYIHNGGADKLIHTMIKTIYDYHDKNTEWAATQRAYLYGFISHIVSDSLFHPFIFYYSGFPDTYTRKEINFFREQNLFSSITWIIIFNTMMKKRFILIFPLMKCCLLRQTVTCTAWTNRFYHYY